MYKLCLLFSITILYVTAIPTLLPQNDGIYIGLNDVKRCNEMYRYLIQVKRCFPTTNMCVESGGLNSMAVDITSCPHLFADLFAEFGKSHTEGFGMFTSVWFGGTREKKYFHSTPQKYSVRENAVFHFVDQETCFDYYLDMYPGCSQYVFNNCTNLSVSKLVGSEVPRYAGVCDFEFSNLFNTNLTQIDIFTYRF
eukprot:TRINITY_DN13335_c0_g1_i1.p1 TRINITY_DN13335_c0_g1~~TRINITY_DN13335_c0_g1_i1.p1  ORF type:complete len:195 (-),score=23.28 TRINITY_DN13335_c0_g1_i1:26-610(-)